MSAEQDVTPVAPEAVDGTITTPGAAAEAKPQEEQPPAVSPVVIRLPTPSSARTLPKSASGESYASITVAPQAHETLQELKLVVNDFVGGYWLGPYSLRIPASKLANGDGPSPALSKVKDGMEIRAGEKLSDWLEVADVFSHSQAGDERILEVVREPYSDVTARQAVQRLLELIMPFGTTNNHLTSALGLSPGSSIFESVRDGTASSSTSEPVYQEIEVALPNGKKGKNGKKEVVKVKKELAADTTNPFADWKADSKPAELSTLPFTQSPIEAAQCLRSISLSPFNPPPPHLRQIGHQLYLQVSILEGDTHTLICTARGWYVSKSNSNTFDPTPRPSSDGSVTPTHSLVDLLHSLSPQFSERLSQLVPLSTKPPPLEPFSTVAIPQHEPAYPWLAQPSKPATTSELLRTQLAYIHTGALTADALDSVRDWNEELQGVRELPKDSMQERVVREKMAQKTWAEFTSASIRSVINVARGDVPPLNPNDDTRGHMWLVSNIFITRAIDCIDTYAHLGGDEAASVSHAKDAAGVKLLNKLDVEGFHLLAHTVVDWQGDRWVCQSCLPGIFSRPKEEAAAKESKEDEEKKDDTWVNVNGSPSKSTTSIEEEQEQPAESHLIIYGLDSEQVSKLHWDETTHKLMEKIGTAYRLAPHKVKDGNEEEKEFYASSEVKVLRGTDNRRYLLDLPRLLPVDVEFQQHDLEGGKLAGPDKTVDGPKYPHRVVLLRPELLESFWENELKRWAREYAAKASKKEQESAELEKPGESSESKLDDAPAPATDAAAKEDDVSPAAAAAAAQREENDKPVDTTISGEQLKEFDLRFNPDAFVELAPARSTKDKTAFIPSKITDESEPSVKAVRDASLFLRNMAIPAVVLDVLTGSVAGVMDGQSLIKLLHGRGINVRYLGYILATIGSFSAGTEGQKGIENGHLSAFKGIVTQEMVFRACKHILRRLIRGLDPEHIPCAVSHFLNCLLGTSYNATPEASYTPFEFSHSAEPAYTSLTPESLRRDILEEIAVRYRWALEESYLNSGLRKPQLLRELATRCGIQFLQRPYAFDRAEAEALSNPEDDKENRAPNKESSKKKKPATPPPRPRSTTFEPSDILTMLPIVKSTAPAVSVAEEIFEAGRNTINRGDMDLGLEFMFEAIQTYENIHSVLHPEVAAAYNQYGSTIHQLARIKMAQITPETADLEQPLGLDVAGALRFQRQAVIIAERTLGVYHHETLGYYFQLAMLENLEGNAQQSLRYFRHVLKLWDVIQGAGHPEINTVLSNAGVVLQANNEISLSLSLLQQVQTSTQEMFGTTHLQTGQTLHQLTQAYFLAGDVPKALESSLAAYEIFKSRLGEENGQTKEVGKNVELLKHVADNIERQKAATQAQKDRSMERLRAAQARIAGLSRRRLPADAASGATPNGDTPAPAPQPPSRIGERGHLDVDELVNFIQGQSGSGGAKRSKNSLRGKRRTGAKR